MWVSVGAGLVALVLLFVGFRALKRKRLIENVPTSKVKGVFMGLNEVKGVAECDAPIRSFLAECECVYYRFSVEEHYEYTETYTDSEGKTQTRTHSGWKTVDSGEAHTPFSLRDDTGALRVDPDGAEIKADTVFRDTCGRMDPLYYDKGPAHAISDSTHERRFTEHALPVGVRLYVIGMARLRDDVVAPEIAHSRQAELFLISTKGEKALTRSYALGAFFALFFGAAAAFFLPLGLARVHARSFGGAIAANLPWEIGAAAIYLGIVFVYYLTLVYNGLVSVRERMEMAQSMIDVQLKRRHILVPRLVACVKGYATHEQETQRRLAEMRTGDDLKQVLALAERYPDLKADANYRKLHDELVDTEDRISFAREFFNEAVTAFNNRIETMPDALLAKLGPFRRQSYFAFERATSAS